ncbi:hypothetical protein EV13_0699 [Prochlorococcus sp. MIT 0702]|nr:hypothetical protein EV13_0699 [Prochlorococcus sp. MIT 0702]
MAKVLIYWSRVLAFLLHLLNLPRINFCQVNGLSYLGYWIILHR